MSTRDYGPESSGYAGVDTNGHPLYTYHVRREVVEWYRVEAASAQEAWDQAITMQRPTDAYIESPTVIYRGADEVPTDEEWEER